MNIIKLAVLPKNRIALGITTRPRITLTIGTSGEKRREVYAGPYEVTPNFEDQTLATNDKIMQDDVTVLQIPVARVSNTAGGNTVTIGG